MNDLDAMFDVAALLLESEEHDIITLAERSGCTVRDFYIGADFRNVDIRGVDLRSLDLTGAMLEEAIYDEQTKVDPVYVSPDWNLNTFKSIELSRLVYNYLQDQVRRGRFYHYTAALRHLVRLCHVDAPDLHSLGRWRVHIYNNKDYYTALNSPRRTRVNMKMKVYDLEHLYVMRLGRSFFGTSAGYNAAAMIGMELEKGVQAKTVADAPRQLELTP